MKIKIEDKEFVTSELHLDTGEISFFRGVFNIEEIIVPEFGTEFSLECENVSVIVQKNGRVTLLQRY